MGIPIEYWSNIDGFDIETEGLNPYDRSTKIISFAVSPESGIAFSSYTLHTVDEDDLNNLRSILENPRMLIVGHNIKYDLNWIRVKFGIDVKCMVFDTMFAQYLLNENIESNSLGFLAERFEDLKGYKELTNRANLKMQSKDDCLIYNCKDADASRRLFDVFSPMLKKKGFDKLMTTAGMVLPILSKMETRGIWLDKDYANKTQVKLFNSMVASRYTLSEIAKSSVDPDSPKALGSILYKELGFTCTTFTDAGQPSTASETLGYLYDQVVSERQSLFLDELISYKKKAKLVSTYYDPIERWTKYDGRVHTNYSLGKQRNEESRGGTVTGRLSSSNPNLQNIPRGKEHRGMFAPTDSYVFLDGDFSQLELRVAAYLSQEPVMMDAFNNGLDIHSAVMADLTGIPYETIQAEREENEDIKTQRVAIKRINFGILYGVQAQRLQRLLRIELGINVELSYCENIIKQWLTKYDRIRKWIDYQKIQAVANKEVGMPLGQKRRLPEASFDSGEGRRALRQATNFPVQSTASWICLIGLIILDQYFQDNPEIDGHIELQVHDSVTSEIKLFNGGNPIDTNRILVDVKHIMEFETLDYLKEVFGVRFNVPLIFDTKLIDRWK